MWGDRSLWFWFAFHWWLTMPNIFLHVRWPSVFLFRFSAHFHIGLFIFLMWICMSSLHIWDINPLSDGALVYVLSSVFLVLCVYFCVLGMLFAFPDFVVVPLYRRNLYGDWQHLSLWPPELCTPGVPPVWAGWALLFMMRPDAVGMPVGGAGLGPVCC